jgi:viroplasmin and RNaseH domain-containing protein
MATKKKYYGVKNGRTSGVFDNWSDCKQQIDKFPNAIFKSFPTEQEAQDYFHDTTKVQIPADELQAPLDIFVDGSYYQSRYSWAFAVYEGDKLIFVNSGVGQDEEAAKMNNVAGELAAAVEAMKWAEENKRHPIMIHHDYSGIAAWAEGSWKAKNPFTEAYAKFASARLSWISFTKVVGHTGVAGNELVDKLAGAALGIK